jgi:hypothetical protein
VYCVCSCLGFFSWTLTVGSPHTVKNLPILPPNRILGDLWMLSPQWHVPRDLALHRMQDSIPGCKSAHYCGSRSNVGQVGVETAGRSSDGIVGHSVCRPKSSLRSFPPLSRVLGRFRVDAPYFTIQITPPAARDEDSFPVSGWILQL